MEWIKINPNHRPAVGHAIYSTFNPEEGGTLYYVRAINDVGFTVESESNYSGKISEDQKVTLFIPFNLIPVTNFYVWDRHRENNYEIDDIYSN
ncbi:hypothetical protein [Paraflavitalea speifideaquila]|uniref:hypothetical protein n=1 Tax=Paraflavitalea speifideaquila TaxID=3076558 RepID=UPI0028E4731A|nr:hypothetical protein [Paraflavitalea speifideiaquila]